MDTYKI
ncbi:unnamed protein product [Acanthoscelides obtectus]|nr:unnamed protein product [Acanthoscelides obtectus]CAK1678703.1 hypothetical protein AOBTE_LOCUS32006 [Acanthoscelides obtectus]